MIGQTISHYKIVEKLGEGGMGIVYKAQDTKLDREVALKFLPAAKGASQDEIRRFLQEASALSSLNHSCIATIYDIDEANGQRFIALEYLPGGTLKTKLKDVQAMGGELSLRQIVEYGIQVAEGLAHAHKRGIVHRDVKLDNLLLTADGKVKISDFGLAKLRVDTQITQTGSTVGTAAYMSPEQVRGEETDARSDIFSFGIVLYELTSGRLPFRGEHAAAVSYSIVNENPVDLGSMRPNVPSGLTTVILKCLEKDKGKRYQSCEDIVADLRKIQQKISGHSSAQAALPASSSKTPWFIVAAIGVLVLGALLYVYVINPAAASIAGSPTIAVLSLENTTGDPKHDSFVAGITDDITNELVNVPGLRVISSSEVRQFRGKEIGIREVGEKLKVSYVLSGSVRVEAGRLSVNCRVDQTQDGFGFWAQSFKQDLKNESDAQSEIAQKVAQALKTKFEQKNIEQKLGLPTNSLVKQ
jgi:eukaryotic-like serine/threonine-protein kinase